MTTDTEKALVEWLAASAKEQEFQCEARGYVHVKDPMHEETIRLRRIFLASLEPKPEPWYGICPRCNASWPLAEGHDCSKSHELSACAKPEPKRGVEEILTLVHNAIDASDTRHGDKWAEGIREALRLYREERERVEKVVEDMNAEASEGIWAAADWRGHVMEWADELREAK